MSVLWLADRKLRGCTTGRVCIDIFKSATECVWKAKLITLKTVLQSALFVSRLCLLSSSLCFNPQIHSLNPWCLHSDLVLSADTWMFQVGIKQVGRCCKGNRWRCLICEGRQSYAQPEDIGRKLGEWSLKSFIFTRDGNGLKRPVGCTLIEILAQQLFLPDTGCWLEDTDFSLPSQVLSLITSCSGTQKHKTLNASAQQYQDICRALRDSAGRIFSAIFG